VFEAGANAGCELESSRPQLRAGCWTAPASEKSIARSFRSPTRYSGQTSCPSLTRAGSPGRDAGCNNDGERRERATQVCWSIESATKRGVRWSDLRAGRLTARIPAANPACPADRPYPQASCSTSSHAKIPRFQLLHRHEHPLQFRTTRHLPAIDQHEQAGAAAETCAVTVPENRHRPPMVAHVVEAEPRPGFFRQ
jgi:hypothetical protein